MPGYSITSVPTDVKVRFGALSATATRVGIDTTSLTGFKGEVATARVIEAAAVTGDNTNRYTFWLCKGTIAAPILIGMLDLLTGTNLAANVGSALTLSGNATPSTTLGAAITTTTATSITVASAAAPWPQTTGMSFPIKIDNEIMLVTAGITTTTWTVTRGYAGSIPTTHSNGATVTLSFPGGSYLSQPLLRRITAGDVIHAIATKNGTASNTTDTQIQVELLGTYDHGVTG